MANADSTVHTISSKNWLTACAALSGATAIAQFVQGVTFRLPRDEDLHLNADEVTGLYHVMQDLIDKIKLARELVEQNAAGWRHPNDSFARSRRCKMSTPTDAQVMIQNALEGLKALNKMEQIAEIISDTSAKEIADELNAMACVMAAAGAMPSRAEAVVRVLVEYIYRTMTSGTPFTDGKWKPYAAMTLEEVKADRKQVHEENMTDINVTDKQRNNPIVDDSAAGTIKNARCVFVALGYAQNCGSTGENLSTGLNLLSLCVHDALNVAELQSKEELPSPWINPIVEICVEATIENARKSLLGVQCVIQGNHDAMGEDYSLGMHFLLCCIDDAMETAILQSKAEERKAA